MSRVPRAGAGQSGSPGCRVVATSRFEYATLGPTPSPEPELVTVESRSRTVQYGGSVRLGYTAVLSPGLTLQVGAGLTALTSRNTNFGTPSVVGGWRQRTWRASSWGAWAA